MEGYCSVILDQIMIGKFMEKLSKAALILLKFKNLLLKSIFNKIMKIHKMIKRLKVLNKKMVKLNLKDKSKYMKLNQH
jgi:hypothetical protein